MAKRGIKVRPQLLLAFLVGFGLSLDSIAGVGTLSVPTGSDACLTCHVPYERHKAFTYHRDCLECHSLASEKHLAEGGQGVLLPDSGKCLACHEQRDIEHRNWAFSDHGRAEVACRACHGIHHPKRPTQLDLALWKTDARSVACIDCHQDVVARLNMWSHHPVKEGAVSCVDCHDPHGGESISLVTGNDRCFACHQAVRGPKVFEHAPVVEDCTICHHPHGSPNRSLLQFSQPMQCLQCHPLTHKGGGRGSLSNARMGTCTHCHGAIHGSHIDPGLKH